MKNITLTFNTIEELDVKLKETVVDDTPSTMIQVFCVDETLDSVQNIHKYFQQNFPKSKVMGTTTDGIVHNSNVYTAAQNVVTFTIFEKTQLQLAMVEHSNSYNSSYETGVAIAKQLSTPTTKLLISFADGIHTNAEEYLHGIDSVNDSLIVSGGMAADNGNLVKTYIFTNEKIISSGAIAIALNSEELKVVTNYTFDWMPIGKKLTVTKAIKNRVYEIDGISAVDIYSKYMGPEVAEKLPQIGIEFPLVVEKDGMHIGRAPIAKHDDNSLTFAGNLEEGEEVRFGVGNVDTILRSGRYQIDKMLSQLKYKTEAVFIYSCMARRRFLDKQVRKELQKFEAISDCSGFFTYGEFFHSKNSNELFNETMTVVLLSESSKQASSYSFEEYENEEFFVKSEHIIAHLANAVSTELAELNENLEKKVRQSSEYIYKQAYFDKLTGLPNRLSLMEDLQNSIGDILFLINIDDFTIINDFYGHAIGDKVLAKLAELLADLVQKKNAQVYKLPSDEYAIIIDMVHSREAIENEIKSILQSISTTEFAFSGHFTHVSVTISAAFINKEKTGLINADMSLKLAKKAGKNYMIFEEDLQLAQQYEKNVKIANIIKDAIVKDKIYPYFQPMFETKSRKLHKYEALVRLETPQGEILTPYHFLDISQKIKLYPQITRIMVDKTFATFKENGKRFSINLAFSDIVNHQTREILFEKIVEYGVAQQLTIEILENQEIEDEIMMLEFINKVYELGAKIAIDDFGSGFANFEHMTKIRSDYMKIDGSLIKNIDKDANSRLVAETIVMFAKKLGKKTVAEFVHSKEVYEVVKELDIDYVQGYYFAEPSAKLLQD